MLAPLTVRLAWPLHPAPRLGGFTLIEVLAAIALLAIALAVGLGALGKATQNASRAVALDTAVERAQTLLAEQGLGTPLKNETRTGSFRDGMHWRLQVRALPAPAAGGVAGSPLPPPAGAPTAQRVGIALYQLDVAVAYGAGRTLRLSTERAQSVAAGAPR